MRSDFTESHQRTITVLGGTGRVGAPYIRMFMDQGLPVRILARNPEKSIRCFPQADVRKGSMMCVSDVVKALCGAAAAFLITPTGGNDDVQLELEAARCAIKAAKAVQLGHLFFLSLIQPPHPAGIPMIDVKKQIENMLKASGVNFSSLRTGCYMDTWLSFFPAFMNKGLYLMPIGPGHQFSFTSQEDVARFAVNLIRNNKVLNGTIDIIDLQPHSVSTVVNLYRAGTGRKLIPVGRWLLPVLSFLRPVIFRWMYPTGASRVGLFNYFNENDWIGDGRQLAETFPDFHITSIRAYLQTRYR